MEAFLILKQLFLAADAISIGAGAGVSASGGFDFDNDILIKNEMPDYYRLGYRTLWEITEKYWDVTDTNELEYYGFWASQVNLLIYNNSFKKALQPYKDLYRLLISERHKYHKENPSDTSYFIVTTNVDHQFQLAGFPEVNILSPQGDFSYLQCSQPCSHDIYDSYPYMKKILDNINKSTMCAMPENVPHCPKCGKRLIPNVSSDERFVEDFHVFNYIGYDQFIQNHSNDNVLILEMGVGYSTPSIIRYPFEKLIKIHKNWNFVRINNDYPEFPNDHSIENRTFSIQQDISELISQLANELLEN